ncbi:hypothetical protein [uncultured Thermosynechococcus sp.]|uniref:hypothetical protein n=1 Tax=uncultured Thermosynechococcus sp. TaxID=436945 RepID=UPI002623A418|nr:hypothetical protein [uncultured Thermosynechococcus sp.]
MKVLEQTSYRLRVRERPWLTWFVGGFFSFIPILMLGFLQVGEIHCQRQTVPYECIITHTSLVSQERVKIPLTLLYQAKLENYIDSDGDRMYRVVLEVAGQSIRLGNASSDVGNRAAIVEQINQFRANPNQTQLSARLYDLWLIGIFAGAHFLPGMAAISLASVLNLDLDKRRGTFTIQHANFFRRTQKELLLREIRDIAIESHKDSDGNTHRIVVHLTSGEKVPLRNYYRGGYNNMKKLANLLRQFLNLGPL